MEKESMNDEELGKAIESYVESFVLVEYGKDGLAAAKDAFRDMELEEEGITFTAFILQTEENLAEQVIEEFLSHV